jgi:hypothetical protein
MQNLGWASNSRYSPGPQAHLKPYQTLSFAFASWFFKMSELRNLVAQLKAQDIKLDESKIFAV